MVRFYIFNGVYNFIKSVIVISSIQFQHFGYSSGVQCLLYKFFFDGLSDLFHFFVCNKNIGIHREPIPITPTKKKNETTILSR